MATTYKIAHEHAGHLVVDDEFASFEEGMAHLGRSQFIGAFLIIDDGTADIASLSIEDLRKRSVQVLGLPNDTPLQ